MARTAQAAQAFTESLNDDLNTAEALAAVFEYVRDANTAMDSGEFRAGNAAAALEFLGRFDSVFDVLKPTAASGELADAEIEAPIAERTAAKKASNFALADQIRDQLLEQGIILEDTKSGVRWKRKSNVKIETQAVHAGDREEARRARSRHHADLYRVELFLRLHGTAGPRLRARRSRATVTRVTTTRRTPRSKS